MNDKAAGLIREIDYGTPIRASARRFRAGRLSGSWTSFCTVRRFVRSVWRFHRWPTPIICRWFLISACEQLQFRII